MSREEPASVPWGTSYMALPKAAARLVEMRMERRLDVKCMFVVLDVSKRIVLVETWIGVCRIDCCELLDV